ncbi:MAG: flagellar hook-associated protein FlgK [Negativicutes bacterium]|nr:flagellar hook-associated protein FlgK [Negativicutes bacterium]
MIVVIATFSGLYTAVRGLYVSQASESVTTDNISNANTVGYSRQTVNQTAVGPAATYTSTLQLGNGAQINSVDRVRNFRLDQKYWQENGTDGEWTSKSNYLTELEAVLNDSSTSDSDFASVMDDFTSALSDLSDDPSSSAARTSVRETGEAVANYLNSTAENLSDLRSDVNGDIKTTVSEINSYGKQIADLNKQITLAAASGANVNSLEDQRDALVDKLSNLTSVQVTETVVGKSATGADVKTLNVNVDGGTLVSGNDARQLECYEVTSGSQAGMYGIRWQDTQGEYSPTGGQLGGLLDLRDGTGTGSEYKGIPYYTSQLDDFARTFAEAFNEGVYKNDTASGYGGHAGGEGADDSTGIRFFSYDGKSSTDLMNGATTTSDIDAVYQNITAANISLSSDVTDDLDKIATASTSGGSDNNENILNLISICSDSKMFDNGTPIDFMNSMISTLGTDSDYAGKQSDSQASFLKNIDDRRTSVSGVSVNEETANLTIYQQAYTASAKAVSMWDEIYQETISMVND